MSDLIETPVGGETPAASVPAQPSGTPVAATPTTPAVAPQTPATGVAPEGYVPSYRIREAREAAMRQAQTEFAQKEAAYNAKMQQLENNLKALVGVQPAQNPEIDAIKKEFGSIYADSLGKLADPAVVEKLLGILDKVPQFEQQNNHYWEAHANQTMSRLYDLASQTLSTPLTEEGKDYLHKSFLGYLGSSPEVAARYERDPSIVEDFWKAFTAHFIEPVRRTQAAQVIARAPQGLPQDTSSGNHITGGPVKPKDLDDRVSQAWAAFNAVRQK